MEQLNNWVQEPGSQGVFREYIKTNYAINLAMNNPDLNEVKEILVKQIRKEKKVYTKHAIQQVLKYAAFLVVFLGLGYGIQQQFVIKDVVTGIVPKEEKITLTSDSGEVLELSETNHSNVLNKKGELLGKQKGAEIIYKDVLATKLIYNEINIPYGKRFAITLSDGSKVHLNSGSTLKYPVNFIKGQERKVFLTGEGYFDVAHNSEDAFVVNAQEIDVRVYGTTFNLTNYAENEFTEVVLVSGSVGLEENSKREGEKEIELLPGFKAAFDKNSKSISKEKVNTTYYTSWVKGNLVFKNTSFFNYY